MIRHGRFREYLDGQIQYLGRISRRFSEPLLILSAVWLWFDVKGHFEKLKKSSPKSHEIPIFEPHILPAWPPVLLSKSSFGPRTWIRGTQSLNVGIAMSFAPSPVHHHKLNGFYKPSKLVVYGIAVPTLVVLLEPKFSSSIVSVCHVIMVKARDPQHGACRRIRPCRANNDFQIT